MYVDHLMNQLEEYCYLYLSSASSFCVFFYWVYLCIIIDIKVWGKLLRQLDFMSGSESKDETSNMVTNAELEKKMQDHEKNNKWLLDELENLKG